MNRITNPILRGFNPDPSIVRVGKDYYIATSTFEWFPGVQIHHSRDLKHWRLLTRPLRRLSQLDLVGNPDSCGVWAPCLSYDDGTFYLAYSNVRSFDGVWKDVHNYLVTTDDITGEWSDPVYLNSSGFDPSLFHDADGRKWLVNMLSDHRQGKLFGGIVMQEYDRHAARLTGPVYPLFQGEGFKNVEGPHLYRREAYYYLLLAEGGTEYEHSAILARSRNLTGPYELHPDNPLITSRNNSGLELQKAGHGDLVQTQHGDWYLAFLAGRPLTPLGRCTLGRETAIAPVEWRPDGWLYLKGGTREPALIVRGGGLPEVPFPETPARNEFNESAIPLCFQSLRTPVAPDWLSLSERPGYLRLYGRESLSSFHYQSLIARRVQHFHIEAATCLEFEPITFQQMAGLVCYYNTGHFYYLHVTTDDSGTKKLLDMIACDHYEMDQPLPEPVEVMEASAVFLKVAWKREAIQFYYAVERENWWRIGPELDGSILSDDYVMEQCGRYRPGFTGSFVGICCQDLSGRRIHADFDWFEYQEA